MDLNNKENGDVTQGRDSVRYVDTIPVASGTATQFLDKPVVAVDGAEAVGPSASARDAGHGRSRRGAAREAQVGGRPG